MNLRIPSHEMSIRLEMSGSNSVVESDSRVEFGRIRVLSRGDEVSDL